MRLQENQRVPNPSLQLLLQQDANDGVDVGAVGDGENAEADAAAEHAGDADVVDDAASGRARGGAKYGNLFCYLIALSSNSFQSTAVMVPRIFRTAAGRQAKVFASSSR